jgi:hypothetical protein
MIAGLVKTHIAVSVLDSSTTVIAANQKRQYILLQNDSDTAIYLGLGQAAVVNTGIRINANGGSYEMSPKYRNLYTGAIYAIAASTGKVLCGMEME